MRKVAVILFNLGGPDSLEAVRPFLFNLFNDEAIIGLPQPARAALAGLIANARGQAAQLNYAHIGGRSPLLDETKAQAHALEAKLAESDTDIAFKCFSAMRYWKPFTEQAAYDAESWGAEEAVLLPLYPQFSSTTTASSLKAWRRASHLPASAICCYPAGAQFARAHANAILDAWRTGGEPPSPRVVFSAHGLPERVIKSGDPYQWQVEQSVAAVRTLLPQNWQCRVAYQSRVGPLKWIGPSTLEEIETAGRDRVGLIVSPIAFVSEHVETLVELDIDYAKAAKQACVPFYLRAKTLGVAPDFIDGLASLVVNAVGKTKSVRSESGERICPGKFRLCPYRA
ncbi:MAG: ferrochelatase [Alphaproteobacteria bacterium]